MVCPALSEVLNASSGVAMVMPSMPVRICCSDRPSLSKPPKISENESTSELGSAVNLMGAIQLVI
ncbi:Uncharacterised protein [Vibrio cholerae]|nr:Uncharacterised protein [Vibrio cholerae]CSI73075.1 Uncharacterised protein [Vibrio cholerae]